MTAEHAVRRDRNTRFSLSRRRVATALAALPLAGLAMRAGAEPIHDRGIVGARAPELDVEFWIGADDKPTTFSMAAQRGRWVHMKCWQSWCPGCHKHGFPALQKLAAAFANEPRVVNLAVQTVFEGHGVNTADKVRKTQLQYGLSIPFGHDPGKRNPDGYPNTMVSYRTGGTPWHVIVDPDGIVRYDGFGLNADAAIKFLREAIGAG